MMMTLTTKLNLILVIFILCENGNLLSSSSSSIHDDSLQSHQEEHNVIRSKTKQGRGALYYPYPTKITSTTTTGKPEVYKQSPHHNRNSSLMRQLLLLTSTKRTTTTAAPHINKKVTSSTAPPQVQVEEEKNEEVVVNKEQHHDEVPCKPEWSSPELEERISRFRSNLDESLEQMGENTVLYQYTRDDNYLMRWLSSSGMNESVAVEAVQEHLKWRGMAKIDKVIEDEDWDGFMDAYPLHMETLDKKGRPMEWWLRDWDVASALENKSVGLAKLTRWLERSLEVTTSHLYELNINQRKCESQAIMIVDVDGVKDTKQACYTCLQVYTLFILTYEAQYPGLFLNVYFVNADNPSFSSIFKAMTTPLQHAVVEGNRNKLLDSFKSFETKDEWLAVFNETIETGQRSERFGGTKIMEG